MLKKFLRPTLGFLSLSILILFVGVISAGCADSSNRSSQHDMKMASMADMPAEVQTAPVQVQEAYQYAVANPDVLEQIPCFCGCGNMGHKSNYACYVSGKNADGTTSYDTHALGCSICVDITQDAMRLSKQGKTVKEIRSYIDSTYAKYGPSNIP